MYVCVCVCVVRRSEKIGTAREQGDNKTHTTMTEYPPVQQAHSAVAMAAHTSVDPEIETH